MCNSFIIHDLMKTKGKDQDEAILPYLFRMRKNILKYDFEEVNL